MKIKGWRKVLKFSFVQMVKTKSFIISTIFTIVLMNLIIAATIILPVAFDDNEYTEVTDGISTGEQGDSETKPKSIIEKVYLYDESGFSPKFDYTALAKELNLEITTSNKSKQDLVKEIEVSDKSEMLVAITKDKNNDYYITAYRPYSEEIIKESHSEDFVAKLGEDFRNFKMKSVGVSDENLTIAKSTVQTKSALAGNERSPIASAISIILPMIISLALFISIFAYGQLVAQSIATEKTSKVMELLLTSVRPLAVVVGKVLAMGLVALLQVTLIASSTIATVSISASVASNLGAANNTSSIVSQMPDEVQNIDITDEFFTALEQSFSNINIVTILMVLVIFVLGFFFYALIAAIIGASVSRLEDLAQANQPLVLIGMVGFYLAYFSTGIFSDGEQVKATTLQIISWYLPISSPFALPSGIFMGQIGMGQAAAAIGILALFVVLFAMVVAKVYESLILHNGERMKFFKILKIAAKK